MQTPAQQTAPKNVVFQLNEAAALEAGVSPLIEKTAGYVGRLKKAKYTTSKHKGTAGLELEFESFDGQRAWLEIWYASKEGQPLKTGTAMINAIMYLTGVPELSTKQVGDDWIAPELENVEIGMVLERENYKKDNGNTGYRMNLRQVFCSPSNHTAAEVIEGKDATAVVELLALLNQQ